MSHGVHSLRALASTGRDDSDNVITSILLGLGPGGGRGVGGRPTLGPSLAYSSQELPTKVPKFKSCAVFKLPYKIMADFRVNLKLEASELSESTSSW